MKRGVLAILTTVIIAFSLTMGSVTQVGGEELPTLSVTIAETPEEAFEPGHYQALEYRPSPDIAELDDIASIAYKFELVEEAQLYSGRLEALLKGSTSEDFAAGAAADIYLAPYMVIVLDAGEEGEDDIRIIEARYGHDTLAEPEVVTLTDDSYFYVSGGPWTAENPARLSEIKGEYGSSPIVRLYVAIGGWAADMWGPEGTEVRAEASLLTVNSETPSAGNSAPMTVEIALPIVAFTVSPEALDFGTVAPGKTSAIDITLKNTGTVTIEVTAGIEQTGEKLTDLYESNLYLGGELVKDYAIRIAKGKSETIRAQLKVPKDWVVGTEQARLSFWVKAAD